MNSPFPTPADSRSKFYPYRMAGQTTVKCRSCGNSGLTSRRLVGKARLIDACGECQKTQKETK